jgi:hypothetical protein
MNPLEQLVDTLQTANQALVQRINFSGQSHLMNKALVEIKRAFDAPISDMPERSITSAVASYRDSDGVFKNYTDLKYACYGLGQELGDGWLLFNDDHLFSKMLDKIGELVQEPRRFRKCYQGLLSSYFSYAIHSCKSRKNWENLRDYLAEKLSIAKQVKPVTGWLTLLDEHQNLLGPKPCRRYAMEIREESKGIAVHQMLREGLGIPQNSWIWQELVLSQVEAACAHDDQTFKDDLDRLLNLIQANSLLSENLIIRCISALVSRYTLCSSRPEHPALRDLAVHHIGNPWLKRTAWDAYVKTREGKPYDAAREMVNGWIKRRLIKDFFEILSDDGSADPRRLTFWLRFEPAIEDMWFALGSHASKHQGADFKDFRDRARGRILTLVAQGTPQNNAFVMRLGSITIVEFGVMGNAGYIYNTEKLPFDLSQDSISGNDSGLKNKKEGQRFIHNGLWEEKLFEPLCRHLDFQPP